MNSDNEPRHHYITAGKLIYTKNGVELSRDLNGLLIQNTQKITRADLGETQKAMQIRFLREFEPPSPDVKILDCFIVAISYLGYMTKTEFENKPNIPPELLT